MLSAKAQEILDAVEHQHGEQVLFHWSAELREFLKSEEAEAVKDYMLSFVGDEYAEYYGFVEPKPRVVVDNHDDTELYSLPSPLRRKGAAL